MNAHVTKRDRIAREVPSPLVGACPAEQLGREIERSYREIAALEDVLPGAPERHWNAALACQLSDRVEVLRAQLQWAKAITLAGVYAQSCELRRLTQWELLEGGLSEAQGRAVERLSALIDRSIRELGGFKEFELGGLTDVQSADDFAHVLAQHTGQDVKDS